MTDMAYLGFAPMTGKPFEAMNSFGRGVTSMGPLDIAVITLAKGDALNTLDQEAIWRRWLRPIFVSRLPNPSLANGALEALRRAAVHAWHGHDLLPEPERAALQNAGYPDDAYAVLLRFVDQARRSGASR
jgi:hypothetical protein